MAVMICLCTGLYAQENPLSVGPDGVRLRVAAGQFRLEPDLESNVAKINAFLEEAAENRVDLIVFPETALTGYPPPDYEDIKFIDQAATEAALKDLQKKAADLSIAIAIGTGWQEENGTWRNRAYFIDDRGVLLEYYDKIQQTGHERKFFTDGKRLPVFEWKGVKLGMLICMDMRYPELWL